MSSLIAEFDPSAATSGAFVVAYLSNGIGTLVVWNDSAWSLDLTFPDGTTNIAPAWCAMIYKLTGPAGSVTWTQDKQANATTPDLSNVWVVAYLASENVPGVFPVALTRQTKSGGGAVTSNANAISNDGNVAGTSIVEATVQADSASAVSLTNSGVLALGTAAHKGQISIVSEAPNSGAYSDVFDLGNGVQLGVFGNSGPGVDLQILVGALSSLVSKINSVQQWHTDSGGFTLDHGTLTFLAGSLSRIVYTHIASVTSTAAFQNHNLGVTPAFCIVVANDGTLSSGLFQAYYESSSMTSTQVKLQSNSAGGIPVGLIAVKL